MSAAHGLADVEAGTRADAAAPVPHRLALEDLHGHGRSCSWSSASVAAPRRPGGAMAARSWPARPSSGHAARAVVARRRRGARRWDGDFWQLGHAFPDAGQLQRISLDDASVLAAQRALQVLERRLLAARVRSSRRPAGCRTRSTSTSTSSTPLGLTDTGPELDPARAGEYAAGYSALATATGGCRSTTSTPARWRRRPASTRRRPMWCATRRRTSSATTGSSPTIEAA